MQNTVSTNTQETKRTSDVISSLESKQIGQKVEHITIDGLGLFASLQIGNGNLAFTHLFPLITNRTAYNFPVDKLGNYSLLLPLAQSSKVFFRFLCSYLETASSFNNILLIVKTSWSYNSCLNRDKRPIKDLVSLLRALLAVNDNFLTTLKSIHAHFATTFDNLHKYHEEKLKPKLKEAETTGKTVLTCWTKQWYAAINALESLRYFIDGDLLKYLDKKDLHKLIVSLENLLKYPQHSILSGTLIVLQKITQKGLLTYRCNTLLQNIVNIFTYPEPGVRLKAFMLLSEICKVYPIDRFEQSGLPAVLNDSEFKFSKRMSLDYRLDCCLSLAKGNIFQYLSPKMKSYLINQAQDIAGNSKGGIAKRASHVHNLLSVHQYKLPERPSGELSDSEGSLEEHTV